MWGPQVRTKPQPASCSLAQVLFPSRCLRQGHGGLAIVPSTHPGYAGQGPHGHRGLCSRHHLGLGGRPWTQHSCGPHTLRPPLVTWEEPSEKSISLAGVR